MLREGLDVTRCGHRSLPWEETAVVLTHVLCWQALHRYRYGSAEGALAILEESLALLRNIGGSPQRQRASVHAKWTLGWVLGTLARDRPRANQLLREALNEATELGDDWFRILTAWCLGLTTCRYGEYLRAEAYLRQGIAIADELGDQWLKSWCLDSLGRVLWIKGEYQNAERLAEESYQISKQLGDQVGVSASLMKLGETAAALGKYDLARQHYQDSTAIASELNDPAFEVYSLVGQATSASALDEHAQAKQLLERALTMAHRVIPWGQLGILVALGQTFFALGEIRQSSERFCEALELAGRTGMMPYALSALVGMAQLLAHEAEPERAVELLALAHHHPATFQMTRDRAQCLLAQLESVLSPAAIGEATVRGQGRDLDDVMAEVLGAC